MSLVYIVAEAPWGPVRIETAASMGALLASITTQPAHIEDVGKLEAEHVAQAARVALGGHDAAAPIEATVLKAIASLKEARGAVSAMGVAHMPVEPAPESLRIAAAAMPIDNPAGRVRKRQRAAAAGEMPIAATPPDVDPAAIRAGLGLTQAAFAAAFGLSVGAVRDWEQGRYQPDGPASVLLRVILHRPDAVQQALGTAGNP